MRGPAKLVDAAAVRIAGENVLDRLERKELSAPFKPQDKRISIWKENPASTQSPYLTSARPFRVGPPGYADENRLAVVVLFFPAGHPRENGGSATYLLRCEGKKWNVIARTFGCSYSSTGGEAGAAMTSCLTGSHTGVAPVGVTSAQCPRLQSGTRVRIVLKEFQIQSLRFRGGRCC